MDAKNKQKKPNESPKPTRKTKNLKAKAPVEPENRTQGLTVVGIGASAGGPSAFLHEQHQRALESYGPPSVIVNERHAIVHVSETAGRYLHQPRGPITGDLLTLVRPELQLELRTVLFHAFEKSRATVTRPVKVQFDGHQRPVLTVVRPDPASSASERGQERQALVLFIEDELMSIESGEAASADSPADASLMTAQLQSEVQRLREQLQITIEEFDSSNEEMKASNEELQSLNKEYRSATEEPETSREELQSVNEELQTVNNDIKNKLDEISLAHQELENLMGATEIGLLFLDRELRIQRFTAGVSKLFNILPTDRGRPMRHLTHKMKYDGLSADAEQVMSQLVSIEHEIQAENNDWYLLRLRPYRTAEDKIQGVVISFVDINKLKDAENEIRNAKETLEQRVAERTRELHDLMKQANQARDLFSGLFHLSPIPTSVTCLVDGKFIDANEAYLEYFHLRKDALMGHTAQELDLPIDPKIRPALVQRLRKERVLRNIEMHTQHPTMGVRTLLVSMQLTSSEGSEMIILTLSDITDRIRAEQQIRVLASELTRAEQAERHRLSQTLHDDLQQRLFAIKMQLAMLREAYRKGDLHETEENLDQFLELLNESVSITRNLSIDLSPAVLHGEDLADALVWLAAHMQEQYGLTVHIHTHNISTRFEDALRVLLFQTIREALFNVVKHAGTSQAEISLSQTQDEVLIAVHDGGKGFDGAAISDESNATGGLMNIRHRLQLIGCTFHVESRPGDGTTVVIHVPASQVLP